MTSAIKTLVPLSLALALLAGCKGAAGNDSPSTTVIAEKPSPTPIEAESRKTGYLHTDDDSATFIHWAKTERQIKGQMQILDVNRDGKTDSNSYSFDGVFDGDNLSLTFRGRHQTFQEGTTWRRMKEAHAELSAESRKPLTSRQLGIVQSRLERLQSLLGSVESRRGSFESSLSSANTRIRDAEEEIARLQTAFAQLRQAVAANTTGEPRAAVTAERVARAAKFARSEINKAVTARDAASSRAIAYDKQATDLYRQAEAFVKTLKSRGRGKRRN